MATPRSSIEAVLHAARDVPRVGTALEAELLGAALLGSVYAVAQPPRDAAVREFVGEFLAATSRRRTPAARAIRTVFAALAPDAAGAAAVRPGPAPPPWSAQVGRVRLVGTWAYGDVYGDQTSFVAVFGHEDPEVGGPEHAVVALVDHNIGVVKDLFVGRPAGRVLAEVGAAAEADELIWFTRVEPGTFRAQVSFHLGITDSLTRLPDGGALATDRALVGARLAALPETVPDPTPAGEPPADPHRLEREFLDSRQAATLDRGSDTAEASVRYALRLILDFTQEAPDRDPLRWSPAVVGLFLLDWVHRRAVLDDDDVANLPTVLRAWSAWASQRRHLPAAAARGIEEAIDTMVPEFARLHRTGERRGAAATAVSQLIADGVDPDDEAAVADWLAGHPVGGADAGSPRPAPRQR
jgi:hypothetical protein